jgi:heterodisulfide reductase subunit C
MEMMGELPCRPCHKPICRLGHHRCMRDIVLEEILAVIRRALAAVGAKDEFASRNIAAFIKSE